MSRAAKRFIIAIVSAVVTVTAAVAAAWVFRQRPEDPLMPEPSELPSGGESSEEELSLPPVEEEVITVLFCGVDDAAELTDVLLYGKLDLRAGTADLLQIPRDTYVGEQYPTGKINSVYSRGDPELEPVRRLQKVLREQYRLECSHYLVLGLEAFRDMVDAVGGVPMDVPVRIEFLPGKVLEAGPQVLDGEQAEWFVRYRKGYALGDIGRIQAQQLFIDSAFRHAKDLGRKKLFSFAARYYDRVETDIPLFEGLSLANEAFMIDADDVRVHMVPGSGVMCGGYAVYEVDAAALAEILDEYFRPEGESGELQIPQVPQPETPPASLPLPQPPQELPDDSGAAGFLPEEEEDLWEGEERWVWEDP